MTEWLIAGATCLGVSLIGFRAWVDTVRLRTTHNEHVEACRKLTESARDATNANTKELTRELAELKSRLNDIQAGSTMGVRRMGAR
jgi:hypothetical protein